MKERFALFLYSDVFDRILGWFLHLAIAFRVGSSVFFIILDIEILYRIWKKVIQFFWLTSSQFVNKELFPSLMRFTLAGRLIFFDKKGLTVSQKRLSVMFFSFRFSKQPFLDFRRSETHLFLCLQNNFRFSSLLFLKKRFLNLLLVMIAL